MKTFDFTQTSSSITQQPLTKQNTTEQNNSFHFNFHLDAETLKPVRHYLTDAISEGLKSNLLGNDINMEYLMLSIRSYSAMLFNTLAHSCHEKKS